MDRLVERLMAVRPLVKIAGILVFAVLVTAVNYFVASIPTFGIPISDVEAKIAAAAREQKRLDQDFAEKQAIANNLNEYRRERDLLDQRLRDALAELPDDKRIDELLQSLQDRAVKSGLEIQTIEPQAQVNEGFYARIPIPMTVEGDYHEVATFLDAIGRLQRIVNVNNLTFESPRDLNGRVVLKAKFLATTFMFVEAKDAKPAARASGAAK